MRVCWDALTFVSNLYEEKKKKIDSFVKNLN